MALSSSSSVSMCVSPSCLLLTCTQQRACHRKPLESPEQRMYFAAWLCLCSVWGGLLLHRTHQGRAHCPALVFGASLRGGREATSADSSEKVYSSGRLAANSQKVGDGWTIRD